MAWFGRLPFARASDMLFGVRSRMCFKYFATKCSWLVSSFGRCRNASGRLTYGTLYFNGYRMVRIQGHRFSVHRAVAFAVLELPTELSARYVHHLDGDAANNRLDNLAYVTHAQNIQSSYSNNQERGCAGRVLSVPVMWRHRSQTEVWNKSASIKAAARDMCVGESRISRHCQNGTAMGDYEVKFAPRKEPELLQGEEWMPMKNPVTGNDVPGRQVSSHGRIKSARGLITRGTRARSGYFKAEIKEDHTRYSVSVHRLVVSAFMGPPPSSQHSQVNHKDLNPGNNHVENLEYVTASENIKHFHEHRGYQSSKPGMQKPILGHLHGGSDDEWILYKSMKDAARILGIHATNISKCARGLRKRVGAYEFRLADSDEPFQLPGEEWRPVDLEGLLQERATRMK